MSKLKSKKIILKCNNCLHDIQVFTNGDDKLTFTGILKYAELIIPKDEIPSPNKAGQLIDIEIGDDYTFTDYSQKSWKIEVKNTTLKKKVQAVINNGADTDELNELGFENTDGQYDIKPTSPDALTFFDDDAESGQIDDTEKLFEKGKFLVESDDSNNSQEAIELLEKAVRNESLKNPLSENLQSIKTTLAQAYALGKDFEKSLQTYEEARKLYLDKEGKYGSGVSWINSQIGDLLISQGKLDEAIIYKEKTLIFDAYLPRIIEFAQLLASAKKIVDALGVLQLAQDKVDFDDYENQAKIGLQIVQILISDASRYQDVLDALEDATLSASLSGDAELLKQCKKVEKTLKKK